MTDAPAPKPGPSPSHPPRTRLATPELKAVSAARAQPLAAPAQALTGIG